MTANGCCLILDVWTWERVGWALCLPLLVPAVYAVVRAVRWVWWTPRRLERALRQQGIQGNPYRPLFGDIKDLVRLNKEAQSKPMSLSHDVVPRVTPLFHQIMEKHGKICFSWLGPHPRVIVTDPELIRQVLSNKFGHFIKPKFHTLAKLLVTGLIDYEGEKWAKHRRIINPAFHVEKLKRMSPGFSAACTELVARWEKLVGPDASCELDVWPELQNFTGDVISRTAFGSCYEEGKHIFQLQAEQAQLVIHSLQFAIVPGYRFMPTKRNRRMKEIAKEVKGLLRNMIMKREKTMKLGTTTNDDLLSLSTSGIQSEVLRGKWKLPTI